MTSHCRHLGVYPPHSRKAQWEDTGLHPQRAEQAKLKRRKSESMGRARGEVFSHSWLLSSNAETCSPSSPPRHSPGDGLVHSSLGVTGAELEPWGLGLNMSPNRERTPHAGYSSNNVGVCLLDLVASPSSVA